MLPPEECRGVHDTAEAAEGSRSRSAVNAADRLAPRGFVPPFFIATFSLLLLLLLMIFPAVAASLLRQCE